MQLSTYFLFYGSFVKILSDRTANLSFYPFNGCMQSLLLYVIYLQCFVILDAIFFCYKTYSFYFLIDFFKETEFVRL